MTTSTTTTIAMGSTTLTADEKQAWTTYVDGQFALLSKALEQAEHGVLLAFALEGVASRLDNKFSTADRKRAAVAASETLDLASILPTTRKGEKAALLEEAFNLCQSNPASKVALFAAMASGKVADLKAAIAAANGKASKADAAASKAEGAEVVTRKAK